MILESAQMLCAAVILSGGTAPYKLSHKNHPCTQWVVNSRSNAIWLRELAYGLEREWGYRKRREGWTHKSADVIRGLDLSIIPDNGLQWNDGPQSMPDEYRDKDPVIAYRRMYLYEKYPLFKWTTRELPYWIYESEKYRL